MYEGEIENKYIILAWKLGLHPSTLAHLTPITSSLIDLKTGAIWDVWRQYMLDRVSITKTTSRPYK
jgi:hypothetical protein